MLGLALHLAEDALGVVVAVDALEGGIKGPVARERRLTDCALTGSVAAEFKAQLVHLEGGVRLR